MMDVLLVNKIMIRVGDQTLLNLHAMVYYTRTHVSNDIAYETF